MTTNFDVQDDGVTTFRRPHSGERPITFRDLAFAAQLDGIPETYVAILDTYNDRVNRRIASLQDFCEAACTAATEAEARCTDYEQANAALVHRVSQLEEWQRQTQAVINRTNLRVQ